MTPIALLKSYLTREHIFTNALGIGTVYLAVLFIALFAGLVATFHAQRVRSTAIANEQRSLVYWEGVVEKHVNYPDAYVMAALHAARLGDRQKAREYVEEALVQDPSSKDAQELQKFLQE